MLRRNCMSAIARRGFVGRRDREEGLELAFVNPSADNELLQT
jgi:hypothetical protein